MSFVYLIRNGTAGLVEIGRAHDIESQRGQFMTGNPEEQTVIDAVETDDAPRGESFLHGMSRRRRRELFELTDEEAAECAGRVRQFLEEDLPIEQEANRLADAECDAPARPPDEEECDLHRQLLRPVRRSTASTANMPASTTSSESEPGPRKG